MLTGPEKADHLLNMAAGVFPSADGMRIDPNVTFVETGTADHLTIQELAPWFERLYTIELDEGFYHQAWCAFMNTPRVTCLYGDSKVVLEHLVYRLKGPAVFWLDAHYCGGVKGDEDTPIETELRHIYRYRQHERNLILIDDARLFGTDPAYPSVEWVEDFVDVQPGHIEYEVRVQDDIIHIVPLVG